MKNRKSQTRSPRAKVSPRRSRVNGATRSRKARELPSETDLHLPNQAPEVPEIENSEPLDSARGDALTLYLREVGKVKLLTPKEEIELARRIKRGDKQAREQMIKANLRLVVKIARDYENLGVPLLDLINEGNIGLMKGVERFNPAKGAKLSTYASWWIKQNIRRALANQGKTIRLPVHVVDRLANLRKAEVRLREVFGRDATDEELAEELQMNPRRVEQYRQASRAPVPLDAPIGDDESSRVAEVVADPNAGLPSDRLSHETDVELVREVLETLSERERAILALRFGLADGVQKTLEEIGEHFGLTRERIRQIQEQALRTLRTRMQQRDVSIDEKAELAISA